MQRLRSRGRDARGSSSVMVAVSLVVLLGFAAVSLDVAAVFNARQRLQIGADAAALAIAADCARGSCGAVSTTARQYVVANSAAPGATATVPVIPTPSAGTVTVRASTTTEHLFAPVLGFASTGSTVTASARWGAPISGRAVLPLIFGLCEWTAQTGGGLPSSTTERVIRTTKTSATGCVGINGLALPGGFGWLTPNGPGCDVSSRVGDWVSSDPGNSPSCDVATVRGYHDQTVLLPIYDLERGNGRNGEYRVHGYAAFRLTGYYFAGQYSWNPPCSGNDRCIAGYFERYVADATDWVYAPGAPSLGAYVVRLTA